MNRAYVTVTVSIVLLLVGLSTPLGPAPRPGGAPMYLLLRKRWAPAKTGLTETVSAPYTPVYVPYPNQGGSTETRNHPWTRCRVHAGQGQRHGNGSAASDPGENVLVHDIRSAVGANLAEPHTHGDATIPRRASGPGVGCRIHETGSDVLSPTALTSEQHTFGPLPLVATQASHVLDIRVSGGASSQDGGPVVRFVFDVKDTKP